MAHSYKYPRPALTVDAVVFGFDEKDDLRILLIQRDIEPYEGEWALPGGFVSPGESLEEAVSRELSEETGLHNVFLEQLYTFGQPDRDPREHVVSVAYFALVNLFGQKVEASTDARLAAWFTLDDLPDLAFDHLKILETGISRLRNIVRYQPIGFELLPQKFTLTQLQRLYETILDQPMDKRNFRKKAMRLGVLQDTGEIQTDVAHRAARLYQFDEKKYRDLEKRGINFEI